MNKELKISEDKIEVKEFKVIYNKTFMKKFEPLHIVDDYNNGQDIKVQLMRALLLSEEGRKHIWTHIKDDWNDYGFHISNGHQLNNRNLYIITNKPCEENVDYNVRGWNWETIPTLNELKEMNDDSS